MDAQIDPLHHAFAAEIVGLDIAEPVMDEDRDLVKDAMAQYAVVAIGGQMRAADADQLRFAHAFGPLELPPELRLTDTSRPLRIARELYQMGFEA